MGGYRARAQDKGFSKVALWYVGSEVLHLATPKFKAVALGVKKGAIHDQAAGCKGECYESVATRNGRDTGRPHDGALAAGAEVQVTVPHARKAVGRESGEL